MNGKLCKLIERRDAIVRQIRELELDRIQHDTLNFDKNKPLYDILKNLNKEIAEEMTEEE